MNFQAAHLKIMQQLEQKIKLKEIKRCIEYKALGSGSMSDPARIQPIFGSMRKIGSGSGSGSLVVRQSVNFILKSKLFKI